MNNLTIKGHTFTPTQEPDIDHGFYLATGMMEIDGVDESCAVTRSRSNEPYDLFFKHKCVQAVFDAS